MKQIRDVRVAVVGGAGFLGSHLVNHLVEDRRCKVLVLDNLCVGRREWVHPEAVFEHCEIATSEEHLRSLFLRHKIQYVFNYAAWPYIPDSFVRPKHVFAVNATGAIHVVNAAAEAGCERVLQVSSAELYGDALTWLGEGTRLDKRVTEETPVAPHSTYGAAKAAADYYCQSAWRERVAKVVILRQFNCCGERESHPYVVPEIISQLNVCRENAGRTREPLGNFHAKIQLGNNSFRDFLYAGDAVRLATELLEKGQPGEVYNLGSETGIQVYDLAKLIGRLMGFADVTVEQDSARVRPWEIWHLLASNEKIYRVIEGRPRVSLEDALRRTIEWHAANGSRWPWEPAPA